MEKFRDFLLISKSFRNFVVIKKNMRNVLLNLVKNIFDKNITLEVGNYLKVLINESYFYHRIDFVKGREFITEIGIVYQLTEDGKIQYRDCFSIWYTLQNAEIVKHN